MIGGIDSTRIDEVVYCEAFDGYGNGRADLPCYTCSKPSGGYMVKWIADVGIQKGAVLTF